VVYPTVGLRTEKDREFDVALKSLAPVNFHLDRLASDCGHGVVVLFAFAIWIIDIDSAGMGYIVARSSDDVLAWLKSAGFRR
jgi:hypothetical protein